MMSLLNISIFFASLGVFFAGIALLWAVSIYDKKGKGFKQNRD